VGAERVLRKACGWAKITELFADSSARQLFALLPALFAFLVRAVAWRDGAGQASTGYRYR